MELRLSKVLKRELRNVKLKEVSEATGISISLLSDWKEGRLPSAKNLVKLQVLADYLELTLSQLLFSKLEKDSTAITLQSTQFRDGDNQYRIIIEKLR